MNVKRLVDVMDYQQNKLLGEALVTDAEMTASLAAADMHTGTINLLELDALIPGLIDCLDPWQSTEENPVVYLQD